MTLRSYFGKMNSTLRSVIFLTWGLKMRKWRSWWTKIMIRRWTWTSWTRRWTSRWTGGWRMRWTRRGRRWPLALFQLAVLPRSASDRADCSRLVGWMIAHRSAIQPPEYTSNVIHNQNTEGAQFGHEMITAHTHQCNTNCAVPPHVAYHEPRIDFATIWDRRVWTNQSQLVWWIQVTNYGV